MNQEVLDKVKSSELLLGPTFVLDSLDKAINFNVSNSLNKIVKKTKSVKLKSKGTKSKKLDTIDTSEDIKEDILPTFSGLSTIDKADSSLEATLAKKVKKTSSKISQPVYEDKSMIVKEFKSIVKAVANKNKGSKKKVQRTLKSGRKSKALGFVVSPVKVLSGAKNILNDYKKQIFNLSLSLIMVAFVGLSSYIAYAYVITKDSDIVGSVAKHIYLPENETPKVYIIQSEKSDIFQNPLFKGIKIGDNVLNYSNSSKVIIYRSSEDRIVNVVNLQN